MMRGLSLLSLLFPFLFLLPSCTETAMPSDPTASADTPAFGLGPADPDRPRYGQTNRGHDSPAHSETEKEEDNRGSETDPGTPGLPPGNTQPGGGSDMGGLSCLTVYNLVSACYTTYYSCADACPDQACADNCEGDYVSCFDAQVSLGSSQAQVEFNALRSCEDEHWDACYADGGSVYQECAQSCTDEACSSQCGKEADAVLQNCMVSACQHTYAACGVEVETAGGTEDTTPETAGSTPAPTPQPAGMNCSQLYTCEDACNGDQSCGQSCYDNSSDAAQSHWSNLIQCGMSYCNGQVNNAEQYKACLSQMCPQPYEVCFSGGGGGNNPGVTPGTSSGDSCGVGYTCIQSCYETASDEASFNNCANGCYNAMNSAALGLMDALKGCADFQCYDVPGSIANYYQCIQDFCPAQYSTCMSQGTTTPGGNNGSTGNDNTGSGNAGTGITSCLDVHEAVLSECVPTYSACVAACFDENCANTCSGEIAACIQGKQNAAPALEAANFGAVLSCRQANFNACNGQADALYMTCESACGAGDNACITQCGADSDAGYEACYEEVCANEYAACGITANGSNPTEGGAGTDPTEGEVETNAPSGDGTLSSCLAIYEAVQSVCDADYVACQSVCNDPPCADQCAQEANACVDTQLASAEKAEDAADYEAVLGCWNTHYDTCFGEGSAVYSDCMATCTDGEAACSQACNVPATEAYAGCYNTACADVYATCGIE